MIRLRPLEITDARPFIQYAKALHRESGVSDVPFDDDKALLTLAHIVGDLDYYGVLILSDDEPVGFGAGMIVSHTFSNALMAEDIGIYVDPKARRQGAYRMALHAFEEWAVSKGCVNAVFSPITDFQEKLLPFLERHGFKKLGIYTRKRLTNV